MMRYCGNPCGIFPPIVSLSPSCLGRFGHFFFASSARPAPITQHPSAFIVPFVGMTIAFENDVATVSS